MSNSLNLMDIDQEQALNLARFFIKSGQNLSLFGQRGTGKQLCLETELPTPSGFIKLKDLKEGDQLFDEKGNICNVVQLHPINVSPESYRITFDDGTTVDACANHLWFTHTKKSRTYNTFSAEVRSTKEILETLKTGSKKETNHSIPTSFPVNYETKNLLIDPYVLGCWLGDGKSATGSIECADLEILEEIKKAGYSINPTKKSINNKSKSSNYRIGDRVPNNMGKCSIGLLKKQLRNFNLLNNKHIPEIYLRASVDQRLALLQGLLDTDGSCDVKYARIEFCSALPQLAHQVLELASSLGIKATLLKNKSFLNGKQYQDRYRVCFITKKPVFRLVRKLANLKKTTAQDTRNTHRYIVDIQPIDPKPMRCITVDSPAHLFLITRSYIATHNTQILIQAAQDCKLQVNYINLSVIERVDLAGYPDLYSKGDVVSFKSPQFLPQLLENQKPDSVILFDEVDKAPPETTAPLLEILDKRTINGKPINVAACLLTGNLTNERSYSHEVSSALLDRCSKYILKFNFEKWIDWAKLNQIHDLIMGFLAANPELACGELETQHYASPSPRGWTLTSQALNKAKSQKIIDIETISAIVSGFVGAEAGLKFRMWYEFFRKFEPFIFSLIETGECSINYNELKPTEKIIFCITACHLVKYRFIEDSKIKPKYQSVEYLCSFFNKENIEPEIQVLSICNSFPIEFVADKKYQLYKCKPFFELSSKLSLLK